MQKSNSFSVAVLNIVRRIPKGTTMTYGAVATAAGNPRAARAVARLMSCNTDTDVPCHRVVRSDGTMGGYNGVRTIPGSALRGVALKRALLASEKV